MFSRLRHLGAESKGLRHLAAGFTDGAVIVHDQEVQEICSLELRRMAMTVREEGGGRGVNIVSLPGDAEINEQLVFSDAICRDGFCLVSGDAASRVSTGNQTPVRGCGELQSLAGSEPFRRMACGPTEPLPLRISRPVRPRYARSRISTGLSNPASVVVMFPPVPSHPCPASCNPRPTDRRPRNG